MDLMGDGWRMFSTMREWSNDDIIEASRNCNALFILPIYNRYPSQSAAALDKQGKMMDGGFIFTEKG